MQTDLDPFRCPAEDAIEIWAIQDVLGVPDNDERIHLVNCPLCHELHSRFVDFYCAIHREAHRYLVAKQTGTANSISVREEQVETTHRLLRPVDRLDDSSNHSRPVAVSHVLLSGLGKGKQLNNSFVSGDGTIIGKFFRLTGKPDWSFQLLSPETSYIGRSILHPSDDRYYFQSNDQGTSLLSLGDHTPSEIQSIELIPFFSETTFDPAALSCDTELVPGTNRIDAGPAGEIILAQEEGDRGEPIVHVALAGMPRAFLAKRVIVALETGSFPPLIEEAIGRDLYFYGVDLFRSFRLWVYLR